MKSVHYIQKILKRIQIYEQVEKFVWSEVYQTDYFRDIHKRGNNFVPQPSLILKYIRHSRKMASLLSLCIMLVINGNKHFKYQTKNPFIVGTTVLFSQSDKIGVATERATGLATLKFNNSIFLVFYKYNHSLQLHVKELKLAYNCAYHIHMT